MTIFDIVLLFLFGAFAVSLVISVPLLVVAYFVIYFYAAFVDGAPPRTFDW